MSGFAPEAEARIMPKAEINDNTNFSSGNEVMSSWLMSSKSEPIERFPGLAAGASDDQTYGPDRCTGELGCVDSGQGCIRHPGATLRDLLPP